MNGFYITVKNGLLDPKHIRKMKGDEGWGTIWLFLWFLDKMTIVDDEIGEGKVLGGKPIKYEDIEKDLGISRATYKRYISLLRDEGYIDTKRTPYGLCIVIYKAYKVFGQKTDSSSKSHPEIEREPSNHGLREPSNIRQDSRQDNTLTTNVVNGETPDRVDNRNKDIQEGIELLRELNKSVTKENLNRYALKRLYKARGKDRVIKAFRYAVQWRQEDKYCPSIYNFMDLEDKWNQLEDYARNLTKGGKNGKESKHFDAAAKLRERRLEGANSQEGIVLVSG